MKKIYIIVFTILCSFLFVGNVRGADLYKCRYTNNDYTVTLNIQANRALSANVDIKKHSLSNPITYITIENWNKTTVSSKEYVGSLGCPKYVAFEEKERDSVAEGTGNSEYYYDVWFNWNKDKANGHCSGKKNCHVITRRGNPYPLVPSCYYDAKGNLTNNRENSVLMVFDAGSTTANVKSYSAIVITSTPKDTTTGAAYEFKSNTSKFYSIDQFQCLDKLYVCKDYIRNEFPTYPIYVNKSERSNCKEWVDDIAADGHKENSQKNGMSSDEWLEDTTDPPTAEECKANPNKPGCAKGRCEVIDPNGELFKILKEIIGYAQIGSIFVVIILSILDLGGAIASSDDDAFRKARGKVGKRIIALILIFLVPLLINFVINLVNLGACKEEDYDFIGNLFN